MKSFREWLRQQEAFLPPDMPNQQQTVAEKPSELAARLLGDQPRTEIDSQQRLSGYIRNATEVLQKLGQLSEMTKHRPGLWARFSVEHPDAVGITHQAALDSFIDSYKAQVDEIAANLDHHVKSHKDAQGLQPGQNIDIDKLRGYQRLITTTTVLKKVMDFFNPLDGDDKKALDILKELDHTVHKNSVGFQKSLDIVHPVFKGLR